MPSNPTAVWALDTNTVMALWVFEDPALQTLRHALEESHVQLASRTDALEEFRRVLAYRQFAVPDERQVELLVRYAARCRTVTAPHDDTPPLPLCRDQDDQKFLEIARDAGASHLITRDKLLLKLARHRLIRPLYHIVTPEAVQAQWQKAQPTPDAAP